MMHQNRMKLGGDFDRLRLMQSTRRLHLSIEDIKGCWGSHWSTLSDQNRPRKAPAAPMVIQFLHQNQKKNKSANAPFETDAGILLNSSSVLK